MFSNFLRAFLMVSLNSVSSGVDEIDPSQLSRIFKMELFPRTTFAFPSAWHAFPLISRALWP